MSKVNMGKVILGGIVGGIVLNIIDYLVNGVWLAPQWLAAASKLNGANAMAGNAIAGYVGGDFIFAIMIVWIYAAIRARYGPGPGTGIKASLAVWVVTAVFACQSILQGLYPTSLVCTSSVCTLVGMLGAGYVGGTLYKE
jgi:hypothetical protein